MTHRFTKLAPYGGKRTELVSYEITGSEFGCSSIRESTILHSEDAHDICARGLQHYLLTCEKMYGKVKEIISSYIARKLNLWTEVGRQFYRCKAEIPISAPNLSRIRH